MSQKWQSQLLLFLKAAVFGFLLAGVLIWDFRLIPTLFFILISSAVYARPFFEGYYTWRAFLILLIVSLFGMKIVAGAWIAVPTILVFSYIFAVLVGIKNYIFVKRSRLYFVAMLLLSYTAFIIFFLADKSDLFLLTYGLLAAALFLLFREWLVIIPSFHFPRRERVAALIAALVLAQLTWAIALFPIGFVSSANLLLLFTFIIAEFLLKHFTGGITKEFIIQHLVFFLVLSAIIFLTSNWSLTF
jgi:hypothetical protein